jgi:antagonist of KipI
MDRFAFEAANLLAGNSPTPAALELGGGELGLIAREDCVVAVAGSGYALRVNVWEFALWGSFLVRAGWTIRLRQSGFGMWAYLAVAGGIRTVTVLDSRSTYLRGHFGGFEGRALREGDMLHGEAAAQMMMESTGQTLPAEARPEYREEPVLEVVPGPQVGEFTEEALHTMLSNVYRVSSSSDRMGYRLEGPRLMHAGRTELPSEGIAMGTVQVPPDGRPIVMMADCATTGGYPKIASVISADLPLLAQCTPGKDRLRFRLTSMEAAQQRSWDMQRRLLSGIMKPQD